MKVVLKHEDIKTSYMHSARCPLALKMQELLNNKDIRVGVDRVNQLIDELSVKIGTLKPGFEYLDYERLRDNPKEIFEAEYTPL